jgi:hypothetical protein
MADFSPDASETLVRRTREWQTLNRTQIQARMMQAQQDVTLAAQLADIDARIAGLPALIQADPVAFEIAAIIEADPDPTRRKECRRVLRMFVFVDDYAPTFAAILGAAAPPARRTVCDRIDERLVKRLAAGDIIEADMKAQVVGQPDIVVTLLQQAMMVIRMKWEGFTTAAVKEKFVRDIFNSPKGYSKSERDIIPWEAPSDFAFGPFMDEWLRGTSNVSLYNSAATSATKSRRNWIADEHGGAGADARKAMWIGFGTRLGEQLGDYDVDVLLGQLALHRPVLKQKLAGLVGPAEIDALVDTNFRAWWIF